MTDSSRSRKEGAGVLPMTETRSEYALLMKQGTSNAEACRMLKGQPAYGNAVAS